MGNIELPAASYWQQKARECLRLAKERPDMGKMLTALADAYTFACATAHEVDDAKTEKAPSPRRRASE
jgi:hypothetical protein